MFGHDDTIADLGDGLRDRIREERSWEQASTGEHDDHRQVCLDGCDWCEGHRQWGECRACGHTCVEFDDDDMCTGCEVGRLDLTDDEACISEAA